MKVRGPIVDYYYRKVGLLVLRRAGLRARSRLRLTHTFVMQRSGEQVPAVSNAHGSDQLIPVLAFKRF